MAAGVLLLSQSFWAAAQHVLSADACATTVLFLLQMKWTALLSCVVLRAALVSGSHSPTSESMVAAALQGICRPSGAMHCSLSVPKTLHFIPLHVDS